MKLRITCGAILRKENKVLLTKRNIKPYKNYWCLPGGHVEKGERVDKAVRREVREETGLEFEPEFFNYYDEIILEKDWHAVTLIFIGNPRGEIKTDKVEVKEVSWFSKKEVNNLNLAFCVKNILKDYFENV
jgi:8-oxo-dGTP diphosphatase